MPSRNTIKEYVVGGHYHIYNRGVEKRIIFKDKSDYAFFLSLLKEYLLPENHPEIELIKERHPRRPRINCHEDVLLVAYCLMPNHFHLLLKLKKQGGLERFMRALLTGYSIYFNQKYERVGHLFQGRYKAALIQREAYLLHLTRYIHRNAIELLVEDSPLQEYSYSSFPVYAGLKNCEWVNETQVLKIFTSDTKKSRGLYIDFVNEHNADVDSQELLGDLMVE